MFVVEIPVAEHDKPEIRKAKIKEIQNLEDYEMFELVEDKGKECIGSRWVITQKEKHDGQKIEFKARLVARGLQDKDKPQSDSPTVAKESLKLLLAIAANEEFELASIDIREAFLQAKIFDWDVFMRPPADQRIEGYVWKLKKPLYGLDDASRKFWLKLKDTLVALGMKMMPRDEA